MAANAGRSRATHAVLRELVHGSTHAKHNWCSVKDRIPAEFRQQSFAVRAEMAVNDATFGFNTHPSFTKTSTGRMEKPRSPSPGHYQGLSSSLSNSSACFGREPRKTDDRIIIQASLSPGVGRYSPPPRAGAGVHGGSFNRTRRWSHNMTRSPGPCTYRPNHIAKSTFK